MNVPDRILRAMHRPTIDDRGPGFARLATEIFEGHQPVFGTDGPVLVFPSPGTGAWEAAIVNTLRPGDHVLMFETRETRSTPAHRRHGIHQLIVIGLRANTCIDSTVRYAAVQTQWPLGRWFTRRWP